MRRILKIRWMVTLLIVAGAVCFWGFKSGDSRSFQIAKNLDIFNSIVKELDMFYVDTIDPNKTIREGIDAMLYSLEALAYGTSLAAMVVTILLWFASYSFVMTSDKFLYLFGKAAPSVSLVLTMILRLLPNYEKKIAQIGNARKSIGMSAENGTTKEKAEHGLTIVSAMTSWALEGGIIMADSMRSRGFGTGKRTTFSLYRFEKRDKILLAIMAGFLAIVIFCCIMGGSSAQYTPEFLVAMSPYTVVGAVAYGAFLALPTAVNITEEIIWYILRSKI